MACRFCSGIDSQRVGAVGGPILPGMEVGAIVTAVGVLIAAGVWAWNWHRSHAERKRDVRVTVRHDGQGTDIYSESVVIEEIVILRVVNHGERSDHVMVTGLETPDGDPLSDDRPKARKIVDDPAREARELPPRGQIEVRFKLPPEAITGGFIGYAELGTGDRVVSDVATLNPGIAELQSMIRGVAARHGLGQGPEAQ